MQSTTSAVLARPSYLFGQLKKSSGGKTFRFNEDMQQVPQEWLHPQPRDFFFLLYKSKHFTGAGVYLTRRNYVEKRYSCVLLSQNTFTKTKTFKVFISRTLVEDLIVPKSGVRTCNKNVDTVMKFADTSWTKSCKKLANTCKKAHSVIHSVDTITQQADCQPQWLPVKMFNPCSCRYMVVCLILSFSSPPRLNKARTCQLQQVLLSSAVTAARTARVVEAVVAWPASESCMAMSTSALQEASRLKNS